MTAWTSPALPDPQTLAEIKQAEDAELGREPWGPGITEPPLDLELEAGA